MKELSHKGVGPPRTFLGSSNTKNSVNAVFIPTVDHQDFVTTQRQDPACPDVVSLREGLGIRELGQQTHKGVGPPCIFSS